ncbi:MAG: GTP pyrophosphokinase [Lachnospiraceae bacterium]|nr:GTP pyrophosphokinase [Lachnospiraceae bacterium]
MGNVIEDIVREKQVEELAEVIRGKKHMQKYSYGIETVKSLLEKYVHECEKGIGRNPVEKVFFRIKSVDSIADKLEKKGYEISYENAICYLGDLAGIRVVCSCCDDVYRVDEFLCRNKDVTVLKRKDYIRSPKANGYQSIHLIIELDYPTPGDTGFAGEKARVEVQIRTTAMHCWAEMDHRTCYKYKAEKK